MIGKNLAAARKRAGMTQDEVAARLDVRRQTYSAYECDISTPDAYTIGRLSSMFGVSVDALLGTAGAGGYLTVPVYGAVAAGIPMEAIENVEDYEQVDPRLAQGGTLLALRIHGASMEPRFKEGDVVIVRRQDDVESGEIAVVLIGGSDATVKKVVKYPGGIRLVPFNPAFEPMYFSGEEIASRPVSVLGKVVELRAKF